MVTIEIGGVKHPLVLTVAAVDELKQLGTSLGSLGEYLTMGDGITVEDMVGRTLGLLALLLREGYEWGWRNARAIPFEVGEPIPLEELAHCFTPGQVIYTVRPLVLEAIGASMSRSIEAVHEKNVDSAV